MISEVNQRILIVDDEEVVRDSLRESLAPVTLDHSGLDAAADALFDAPADNRVGKPRFEFSISEASNGRDAIKLVAKAREEGKPFAVIFMDMRMPGCDGLETVQQIRKVEKRAEIVFVTAYSDHTIEEVIERAGPNVGYYCKPFAPEEIRQVAIKATYDWNRNSDLERLIRMVADLRTSDSQMQVLFSNILHQVGAIIGSTSALIARRDARQHLVPEIGTGEFHDLAKARALLKKLEPELVGASFPVVLHDDHLLIFQLDDLHLVAVFGKGASLNAEKFYLLSLLLESAGTSIKNSRLQLKVAEKEKLSALGQALGGIVHDLRNPIGAIQSLSGLMAESLEASDVAAALEMQKLIVESSDDAMNLLEDVLDYTRTSSCALEPVDVRELLRTVEQKAATIMTPLEVPLVIPEVPEATILGDGRKLLRVFLNLIKNAAEALHGAKTLDPEVRIEVVPGKGGVTFSISDNGPGIPAEIRDELFRPFVTSGKTDGTGLGLSIVQQIIEAHGATIEIKSEPGRTCFRFAIPVAVQSAVA